MAKHEKPKAASKITRNPDRRNGKAFKKNPHPNIGNTGGKYGYSYTRLEKMAKDKGISLLEMVSLIGDKVEDKRDRKRHRTYNHAFRSGALRPGVGEVTYKMTSVHRHLDKSKPYPIVPKGSAHAGKAENKTDTAEAKQNREARRNGKPSIQKVLAAA